MTDGYVRGRKPHHEAGARRIVAVAVCHDREGATAAATIAQAQTQPAIGHDAIRALYVDGIAKGRKFAKGKQSPAVINGDIALTSTQLPDGSVTAEVARRQSDGTWLWIIDRYSVM